MLTMTQGSTAKVVATSGSIPAMMRRAASDVENARYEINGMVQSRMKRMLVMLDMHGDDIREILSVKSQGNINIHDGRSVMREAILSEMNRLNRDIQKVLERLPE